MGENICNISAGLESRVYKGFLKNKKEKGRSHLHRHHLTKYDIPAFNGYQNSCSTALIIRDMQFQQLTCLTSARSLNETEKRAWSNWNYLIVLVGMNTDLATLEKQLSGSIIVDNIRALLSR